jgi:hypothetical protein
MEYLTRRDILGNTGKKTSEDDTFVAQGHYLRVGWDAERHEVLLEDGMITGRMRLDPRCGQLHQESARDRDPTSNNGQDHFPALAGFGSLLQVRHQPHECAKPRHEQDKRKHGITFREVVIPRAFVKW